MGLAADLQVDAGGQQEVGSEASRRRHVVIMYQPL